VPHGREVEFRGWVPAGEVILHRLASTPLADASQFVCNKDLGKARLWPGLGPGRGEDHAQYQGISAFDDPRVGVRLARSVNEARRRKGQPPRWTHIARFVVDGHSGQVVADTRSQGHFSVWGDPAALASTVRQVLPI
jgi:hypothetical protein